MKIFSYVALGAIIIAFFAMVIVFQGGEEKIIFPETQETIFPKKIRENAPPARAVINTTKFIPDDYALILDRFKGEDVARIPIKEKVIALTFDGGGDAQGAETILAALSEYNIPATFFITGVFFEKFPDVTDKLADYELANHSLSHRDMTALAEDEFKNEINGLPEMLCKRQGLCGLLAPFFRFPYGARDAETITRVNKMGYTAVRWTVDSLGWQGRKNERDERFVFERVMSKAEPGAIVLMHLGSAKDGSTLDADALADIIRALSAQGYRFATLSELFVQAL